MCQKDYEFHIFFSQGELTRVLKTLKKKMENDLDDIPQFLVSPRQV
jgi:hypothetical protein